MQSQTLVSGCTTLVDSIDVVSNPNETKPLEFIQTTTCCMQVFSSCTTVEPFWPAPPCNHSDWVIQLCDEQNSQALDVELPTSETPTTPATEALAPVQQPQVSTTPLCFGKFVDISAYFHMPQVPTSLGDNSDWIFSRTWQSCSICLVRRSGEFSRYISDHSDRMS
jgi:hypothetical protein